MVKEKKNSWLHIFLICFSAFLISCGNGDIGGIGGDDDDDNDNTGSSGEESVENVSPDFGALMIELPDSMASSESGSSLAGDDEGGLENLFLMPRMFLGMSGEMTDFIKDVADHVFGKPGCRDGTSTDKDCEDYMGIVRGDIEKDPTVFEIPEDKGDEGAPDYVKFWKNDDSDKYDYTFELYWEGDDGKYYPGMVFEITPVDDDQAKGEFTFFPSMGGGDNKKGDSPPGIITIEIDASKKDKKSMTMYMFEFDGNSLALGDDDDREPESLGFTLNFEDDILSGSGSMIMAEQKDGGGDKPGPFGSGDTFAFVFGLAANPDDDVTVLQIAIPTEDQYDDEKAMFTEHGIDNIMMGFVVASLRTSTNGTCTTLSTALGTDICATNTSLSNADAMKTYRVHCKTHPDSSICGESGLGELWAPAVMVNPFYLDKYGYVSSGHDPQTAAKWTGLAKALEDIDTFFPNDLKDTDKPDAPKGVDKVE